MNVFLTGCTGFLGSHILYHLCKQNKHQIICLVRKISDINLFKSYPNIITKVRFVLGDIIEIQKYRHMLQKCNTVIHTASPFVNKKFDNIEEAQSEIIDPAINYIKIILNNVDYSIFKRIIFTSSMSAVYKKDTVCDENCWNLDDENPNTKSKVLSEIECFKYNSKGIDVISINSGALFGPDIILKQSRNNKFIFNLLNSPYYQLGTNIKMMFCDVRDVAKFHVLSLSSKIKHGRYIVCNKVLDAKSIIMLCKKIAPHKVKVPIFFVNKKLVKLDSNNDTLDEDNCDIGAYKDNEPKFNNSKSKKYIKYTKVEKTLEEMMRSM